MELTKLQIEELNAREKFVETIGDLKALLKDVPDELPIRYADFGGDSMVGVWFEDSTGCVNIS
jgi:hypothetical protein